MSNSRSSSPQTSQWRPTDIRGWSRLSATASSTARPVTMRLALATTPRSWHSMMPRLIPGPCPKSSALKITRMVMASREPRLREQPARHALRREVLLRYATRRLAVAAIVTVDRIDGGEGLIHGAEGEETLPGGQHVAEPGVLGDDGLPARQVAGVAFAEPAAPEADVLILRDGQLAPRGPEVARIRPKDIERHGERRDESPAMGSQDR